MIRLINCSPLSNMVAWLCIGKSFGSCRQWVVSCIVACMRNEEFILLISLIWHHEITLQPNCHDSVNFTAFQADWLKYVVHNFNIVIPDWFVEFYISMQCQFALRLSSWFVHISIQYWTSSSSISVPRSEIPGFTKTISGQWLVVHNSKWILLYYISKHPWAKVLVMCYFVTDKALWLHLSCTINYVAAFWIIKPVDVSLLSQESGWLVQVVHVIDCYHVLDAATCAPEDWNTW